MSELHIERVCSRTCARLLADLEVNHDQIKASHSCSWSLRGKWRKAEPIPMAKIAPCRFNILSAIINRSPRSFRVP